jgi:DNA recombination protein RmuC
MTKMDDVLGKLAASASTMSNNIEKVRVRTRQVGRVLRNVEMVEASTAQELLGIEAAEDDEAS